MKDETVTSDLRQTAVHRLNKDYLALLKDPIPFAVAAPNPTNFLDFHFCIFGSPDTPYEGGYYHGRIIFPSEFPFKPPVFLFLTPTGRFEVSKPICLSISHYEPKSWSSSWTLSTILIGLISFMNEETPTFGSLFSSMEMKRRLAKQSREYNMKDKTFCELFSELTEQIRMDLRLERGQDKEESNEYSDESDLDSIVDYSDDWIN